MKREILCKPCAEKTAKSITGSKFMNGQIVNPYPGEHAKFMHGVLIRHCLCDSCSAELDPEVEAVALSIWADYGGIPYYPWEIEFFGDDKWKGRI